jgi:hypothetical protein
MNHRANTVYDVSNRETFEALPRWLEELENYVPSEVVKIVVGNKLDKVTLAAFLFFLRSCLPLTRRILKGILTAGANCRGRGVRSAHGMSVR